MKKVNERRKSGSFIHPTEEEEEPIHVDDTSSLLVEADTHQVPIVYSPQYNITFMGLQRLHPFDSEKWGRIHSLLIENGTFTAEQFVTPKPARTEHLRQVHTQRYLNSLKWSAKVSVITEVSPVALLPNCLVQRKLLQPLRHQTGGSVASAALAMTHGWSIHLGGGFHHCSSDAGGGFCAYADISLAVFMSRQHCNVKSVMIVDLDAHQGNGHERDFINDENVYIMDVYNARIYPRDFQAKDAIRKKIELDHHTRDDVYLGLVQKHLRQALEAFRPDLVIFNAGTDILIGDPLGNLDITPEGVIRRDEIVFYECRSRQLPVCMFTSGGYQRQTAEVIADSIRNLQEKNFLS